MAVVVAAVPQHQGYYYTNDCQYLTTAPSSSSSLAGIAVLLDGYRFLIPNGYAQNGNFRTGLPLLGHVSSIQELYHDSYTDGLANTWKLRAWTQQNSNTIIGSIIVSTQSQYTTNYELQTMLLTDGDNDTHVLTAFIPALNQQQVIKRNWDKIATYLPAIGYSSELSMPAFISTTKMGVGYFADGKPVYPSSDNIFYAVSMGSDATGVNPTGTSASYMVLYTLP